MHFLPRTSRRGTVLKEIEASCQQVSGDRRTFAVEIFFANVTVQQPQRILLSNLSFFDGNTMLVTFVVYIRICIC